MKSSEILRTDLMVELRYSKGFKVLASEVKYNKCASDVLAVKGGKAHEFEVKVSLRDFQKDFTKQIGFKRYGTRENKHESYNSRFTTKFVPHYFNFVVDSSIEEAVLKHCQKSYKKYGVISWDSKTREIKVLKRALMLNSKPLQKGVVDRIVMRATSELVTLKRKLAELDQG